MNEEETMEKLRNFLKNKAGLDTQGCYFITKKLNEDFWGEVQDETQEEPEDDDFDMDEGEEIVEEEDLEIPQPKKASTKKKAFIKKPKVELKDMDL